MSQPSRTLCFNSTQELRNVLFNAMTDGVLISDEFNTILDCNPAFHRRLGYEKHELIGAPIQLLATPEFTAHFHERILQFAASGEATFESAHRHKDGSVMPVEINARSCSVAGETVFIGIVRDISERKKLEHQLNEGLGLFQAAINTTSLGFWAADANGRFLEVNEAYVRQSGYSRNELLRMGIPDVEALDDSQQTAAYIEEIMASGFARFRSEHRRKDGSIWPVEVTTTYTDIQGGRFFVFIEDIGDKVVQERGLLLAASVFETMDQAVVVTDEENRIISINPATTEITGYRFDELRGQNPRIFSSGRQEPSFYAAMWQALKATGHWEGEIWDRRKDGSVFLKWLTINALYDDAGRLKQYVSIFSDITERKKTEELIWRQANFDALTGLANRLLFQSRLKGELDHCQRQGRKLAVLYIDLDGFKDINDSLGHAAGDQLLVEVSQRLQQRIRKSDTVARLGGDEFTLLITDFDHPEKVGSLAEEILTTLKEPIRIGDQNVHIGASIGVALYPDDGNTLDELTMHADTAMYQAKAHGKNTFEFFQPEMNLKANFRLTLIHDLHRAVKKQGFELHYQPKIRLADQRIVGMEALLRWPRADGGMTSPADFIPCAEETGLILDIGHWVLRTACRQTHLWNRRFGCRLQVAVNLSARQFHDEGLVDQVLRALDEQGLPGSQLELEITESVLMGDVERAIGFMGQLRDHGISIAIDDFGTGYSSLSYLKRFPINTLKIDQSFVRDLVHGSEDATIVRAVISLATNLKLAVVAEGVEYPHQLDFLRKQQCHLAQGYHIASPMDTKAFEAFLAQHETALARS